MDVRSALKSQYHAALKTLHEVIEKCPEQMWNDPADPAPFWRVAYHTLFFAHFYLQQKQEAFVPWARHRDEAQYISSVPREGHRPPKLVFDSANLHLIAPQRLRNSQTGRGTTG
jgi:hypothetical protein